jgi:CubicO group peptidase (beta-lactamase class C family)
MKKTTVKSKIFTKRNTNLQKSYIRSYKASTKYFLFSILISVTCLQVSGQPNTMLKDGDLSTKIDSIFSFIQKDEPGCILGIIENGSLTHQMNYGLASIEWDQPITPLVRFNIASISKQFTSAAIILLAKDKVLSLDDNIRKWIPEMPEYGNKISINNLLHHTSGIRDYLDLRVIKGKPYVDIVTEEDGLKLLSKQNALNFEPGEKFEYSNSGYLLAAVIVRRASGKSLREYCQEYIFSPLKMNHTQFWDNHQEIIPMMATGYKNASVGFKVHQTKNNEIVGDGNLITTVADLALWDKNFYTKEIGGEYLHSHLHERGVLNNGEITQYACGLEFEEYNGLNTIGHGGSTPGFLSYYVHFPEKNISIVLLSNRKDVDAGTYVNKVADILFFQNLQKTEKIENDDSHEIDSIYEPVFIPSVRIMNEWRGTYRREHPTSYISIESIKDELLLNYLDMSLPIILNSKNKGEVEALGSVIELKNVQDSKDYELIINGGRPRYKVNLPLDYMNGLSKYSGVYRSDELDVEYQIKLTGSDLFLSIPNYELQKLNLGKINEFFFLEWIIEFQKDDNGMLSGFKLNTGRVMDIEFTKIDK